MSPFIAYTRNVLAAALATAVLAGCAIHPRPLTLEQREATLATDSSAMFADQAPVTGPITLDEAMARALKYNLDHRVKLMEEALAQRQLDLSKFDLLPQLVIVLNQPGKLGLDKVEERVHLVLVVAPLANRRLAERDVMHVSGGQAHQITSRTHGLTHVPVSNRVGQSHQYEHNQQEHHNRYVQSDAPDTHDRDEPSKQLRWWIGHGKDRLDGDRGPARRTPVPREGAYGLHHDPGYQQQPEDPEDVVQDPASGFHVVNSATGRP